MDMNTLPISELRKLLTVVSEHGERHLVDVESDLTQAAFLLNEAIEKLSASFMAIDEQMNAQKGITSDLHSGQISESEAQTALGKVQSAIQTEVGQIVTNMQFQDMTNQIIERSQKRINGLKGLMTELGNHGVQVKACEYEHEKEDIEEMIQNIKQSINAGSNKISNEINARSVDQKDMTTGSVDLF